MITFWSMLSKSKFLIILFLLLFSNCKQNQEAEIDAQGEQTEYELTNTLPDDFLKFHERFQADSLYQMAHIVFPMKGNIYDENNQASITSWIPENWVIHKPFDITDETFVRSFTVFGGIISEKIGDTKGIITMERRFAKFQDEWHLIFYDPMHLGKN